MNALMSILFVVALMIALPMNSEGAPREAKSSVVVQPH